MSRECHGGDAPQVVAQPEDYSWESVRPQLAELYAEADMGTIAGFVSAPTA